MKLNPYDVLKSKFADYRERTKRGREINREEAKAGKTPIPFIFIGIALILAIAIALLFSFIIQSPGETQVLIILIIQTVVIAFQSWVMYSQTRNEKMSNLPEFIILTKVFTVTVAERKVDHFKKMLSGQDSDNVNLDNIIICLKNIGQTAHRVSFRIIATKRGETVHTDELHPDLFTIRHEEEKDACKLRKNEYISKRIRIDLGYLDKMGKYCSEKFLKLEEENDFERIFTGLE